MSKTARESLELPDYDLQTAPLLENAHAHEESSASVLRGTGIIRVDAIEYPFNVVSGTTVQELAPRTLTTFLIDYSPNYMNIIEAVREQLENSSVVDLKRLEFSGIRMAGRGPQIGESVWARIGSKLPQLEVMLDVPAEVRARQHRVCSRVLTAVFTALGLFLLGCFAMVVAAVRGYI